MRSINIYMWEAVSSVSVSVTCCSPRGSDIGASKHKLINIEFSRPRSRFLQPPWESINTPGSRLAMVKLKAGQ